MTIDQKQDAVIKEFETLEGGMEKYEHLIALGRNLKPIHPDYKTDQYAISGCQTKVWLKAELHDRKLHLQADSNTMITRGIIALLLQVLNRQPPRDILNSELYFIDRTGLNLNLSPTRSNGLAVIVRHIRKHARKWENQSANSH